MKIILYSDEHIYQKIYEVFSDYDSLNDIEYHYFDRDNFDIKHITTNRFINYSINNIAGYRHVTHVLIQKSFYRNRDVIKILRRLKTFNPDAKVLLIFDDEKEYYDYLLHIIADEKLCSIAFTIDDVKTWFSNQCNSFDHTQFILKKIRNKQKKEFLRF